MREKIKSELTFLLHWSLILQTRSASTSNPNLQTQEMKPIGTALPLNNDNEQRN